MANRNENEDDRSPLANEEDDQQQRVVITHIDAEDDEEAPDGKKNGEGEMEPNERHALLLASRKPIEAPPDRRHLVYAIMLLHGIGVLMPWNMFITIAPSYYVGWKLKEPDANGTLHDTTYSLNFFSYLGLCSQVPSVLMNLCNIFLVVKGGLERRMTTSLVIVGLICVMTIILAVLDTRTWVTAFFFISMASVVLLNAANGIYQNCVYGMAADFPARYTNAVVLGNNVCGTFVSVVNIVTQAVTDTVKVAALLYFGIALLTIVTCFNSFFLLKKLAFFRHFYELGNAARIAEAQSLTGGTKSVSVSEKLAQFADVFKQGWVQMFNVFFVFFVSLAIFPAVQADIRPQLNLNGTTDFPISDKYFTPVTTFLLFNVFAMLGSLTANFVQWPRPSGLVIPVLLRAMFIPFFVFCNFRPTLRTWPVLFYNEWLYVLAAIVMSWTSGYFSSLSMMYAPRVVEQSKSRTAGMMAAFFLITGICSGIAFTFVITEFTNKWGPMTPLAPPV